MRTPTDQEPFSGQQARHVDVPPKVHALADDSPSTFRRYGMAALCVAGAVLLRWLLDPILGRSYPLATIFGFVGIAVWYGGWGPALFTVIMSYLVVHWLIIEPAHAFDFSATEVGGLSLYLFSTGVLIGVGQVMRDAQRQARLNAAAVTEKQWKLEAEFVERQQAEAALRESEVRYRETFANAAVGIAHVALDGRWLGVNDAICRITG